MTAAKMALVVSHRLAPARQADLIVAMDGSRVVAAGTHQELTRAGGPYLEMFARRARFGWDFWGDESLGTAELAVPA